MMDDTCSAPRADRAAVGSPAFCVIAFAVPATSCTPNSHVSKWAGYGPWRFWGDLGGVDLRIPQKKPRSLRTSCFPLPHEVIHHWGSFLQMVIFPPHLGDKVAVRDRPHTHSPAPPAPSRREAHGLSVIRGAPVEAEKRHPRAP